MKKILRYICEFFERIFSKKKKEKVVYNYIPYFKLSDIEFDISELINDYRLEKGLKPLLLDKTCKEACDIRTEYTADKSELIDHAGIGTVFSDMRDLGLSAGEILARGYSSAISVFKAWKRSDKHNGMILDPSYEYFSVGVRINIKGTSDYCVIFTKRK